MGFEFINKLPTPAEIKEQFPLPAECALTKAQRDQEAKKIISGDSDKFLVIIGPCSADNEDSVLDYVSRLIKIQEDTREKLLIIPRVTRTSRGLPVKDIKVCFTSRIRKSVPV